MDKIKRELAEINSVLAGWEISPASEIERDVVLEKLRSIYTAIKNSEVLHDADSATMAASDLPLDELPVEPVVSEEYTNTEEACPVRGSLPEQELPQEHDDAVLVSVDVAEAINPEDFAPEGDSAAQPRHKLNKQVIMSLYGDDAPRAQVSEAEPAKEVAEEEVAVRAAEAEQPAAAASPEKSVVLGDVLSASDRTIADTYADQATSTDVAGRISASQMGELRKSIGINDRFLMIRDLFAGDGGEYDEAIARLDKFAGLDDALLYIHETYDWNPDSEGAVLLIDLLTRKLS